MSEYKLSIVSSKIWKVYIKKTKEVVNVYLREF